MKYFMNHDLDEMVWSLNTWKERMMDKDMKEICDYGESIRLELCKREVGGEMWCKEEGQFVERGTTCGKNWCGTYSPCNGKSGRCRHLTNGFEGVEEFYILTKDGKLTKEV